MTFEAACDECPFDPDADLSGFFIRFGSGCSTATEYAALPDPKWRCHKTTPNVVSDEGKPCVGLAIARRKILDG